MKMKTKLRLLFFVAFVLSTTAAHGKTIHGTFSKKLSGPNNWSCGMTATIETNGKNIGYSNDSGPSLYFSNVNEGKICDRHQNGSIVGTLYCRNAIAKNKGGITTIENYRCATDVPFIKSCNPYKKAPESIVVDEVKQEFSISLKTGSDLHGQPQENLGCLYKLAP